MGCVGVGHAKGKVEEELHVPGWSLHGEQQRLESHIDVFPNDTVLAPLLSTFQLCSLLFSLPNSCFYFLEVRGGLWCMEWPILPCLAHQWDLTQQFSLWDQGYVSVFGTMAIACSFID